MKATSSEFRLHPDVLVVNRPDGTSWLLHMSANACRLDADSTGLLHLIVTQGAARAVRKLAETFHIDDVAARSDIDDFIRGLLRQRVLEPLGRSRGSWKGNASRRVIRAALTIADARPWSFRARVWLLLLVARLAVACFGWARTIEAWQQHYPQPHFYGSAESRSLLVPIDHTVRQTAARSLLHHECKERALACMALARSAGMEAELVVGLTYIPLAAHVWVECGGRIISDDPEHCRPYEVVVRYGRSGTTP